jgi:diphosphoinositol-polyphosphate diphosphatase
MPHTVGGPLPTAARQGREQQKYTETGARCVAGSIPIRYSSSTEHNTPSGAASARVLMITSRNGKGYVFPKGGWEVDESVEVAAQRETVEEAGVRGELELPILGTFAFRSGKAERQNACALKGRCVAYMFAMRVSEELDVWPEAQQRHRVWVSRFYLFWNFFGLISF